MSRHLIHEDGDGAGWIIPIPVFRELNEDRRLNR